MRCYARAAWTSSNLPDDAGRSGQPDDRSTRAAMSACRVRACSSCARCAKTADRPLPPYLKSMLGGMPNLRGFKAGPPSAIRWWPASIELRVPLSSPLSFGKVGVTRVLSTLGTTYDNGERLREPETGARRSAAAIWFSAAFAATQPGGRSRPGRDARACTSAPAFRLDSPPRARLAYFKKSQETSDQVEPMISC